MKIYTIRMSEDGLDINCFTNIKALYNGILQTGYVTENDNATLGYYGGLIKFNYPNLVKELNKNSQNKKYYSRAYINCENNNSLEIQEMNINSK
jgi:hypothetical protein